jgi:hypothetical protein
MLHHSLAFCNGELTEQKETFAWSSGNPIWVATASVEECRLRRSGGFLGELDELVLNLERAQRFERTELH